MTSKTQTNGSSVTLEWAYGYDNANHLTSAVETQIASSTTTLQSITYEYDPFSNLVKETEMASVGMTTLEFAVDGWNPSKSDALGLSGFDTWAILKVSGSGSTAFLQSRNIFGNGIDQILGRVDTSLAIDPAGAYFTLRDKDGSVRDVLDSTQGDAPVDVITYDAFGTILSQMSTNPLVVDPTLYLGRYGFDGYDWDAAARLNLVNARVYDPQSQRWMSQDPLGFDAGDSNLYRYVNNALTIFSDPSGFQAWTNSKR